MVEEQAPPDYFQYVQSPFVAPHPASYVAHYNNALPQYNPHVAAGRHTEDEKTRVVLAHPPPNKENLNVFANSNAIEATRSARELDRFVEEN